MNLRQIRKKIKSVKNVGKITRAMQLVSSVKMKKSQSLALEGRLYRDKLTNIVRKISQKIDISYSPLLQKNESKKKLIILISSNKGLCGSFNINLFKFLDSFANYKETDFVTVGKKGAELVVREKAKIVEDFSIKNPSSVAQIIFDSVVDKFLKGEYGEVLLVYNKFISTLKHVPIKFVLLPLAWDNDEEDKIVVSEEYLIEPSPKQVVDSLLNNFLEETIRAAILDSEAAEHSARMMAMKNATDNANELAYQLNLVHNRIRQEKITSELLDMITAKESVDAAN